MSDHMQNMLECSICLDKYTSPKVLPCVHTFCLECLRGHAGNAQTLNCPECREKHKIPNGKVDDFRDNFYVRNLLEIVPSSIETKCSECNSELLCADCCRVGHVSIQKDIDFIVRGSNGAQRSDQSRKEILNKVADEKKRLQQAFDEIQRRLNERRDELSMFLDNLEGRVRIDDGSYARFVERRVSDCTTSSGLLALKQNLEDAYTTLEVLRTDGSEFTILYDYNLADSFGEVNADSIKTRMGKQLVVSKPSTKITETPLPTNVNYQAKDLKKATSIALHPEPETKLAPLYAAYSESMYSIFCISESASKGKGPVIVYKADGSRGRVLSSRITYANHMALTRSDKIIIAQGDAVLIADLAADGSLRSEPRRLNLTDLSSVTLVCCHGDQFAVLDAAQKKIVFYTEAGDFVHSESIAGNVTADRKLTVDKVGRIYVTLNDRLVYKREEIGDLKGCHEQKHSKMKYSIGQRVVIIPWRGGGHQTVTLSNGIRKKTYTFNQECEVCHERTARNEGSIPTDDEAVARSALFIRGICIDGSGYTSITLNDLTSVQVFNSAHKLIHAIDLPSRQDPACLLQPRGVSLMPDGRFIVCDYGKNRIQIV